MSTLETDASLSSPLRAPNEVRTDIPTCGLEASTDAQAINNRTAMTALNDVIAHLQAIASDFQEEISKNPSTMSANLIYKVASVEVMDDDLSDDDSSEDSTSQDDDTGRSEDLAGQETDMGGEHDAVEGQFDLQHLITTLARHWTLSKFNSVRLEDRWAFDKPSQRAVIESEKRQAIEQAKLSTEFATMSELAKQSDFPFGVRAEVATKLGSEVKRPLSTRIGFVGHSKDYEKLREVKSQLNSYNYCGELDQRAADETRRMIAWLTNHGEEAGGGVSVHVGQGAKRGHWFNFTLDGSNYASIDDYIVDEALSTKAADREDELSEH